METAELSIAIFIGLNPEAIRCSSYSAKISNKAFELATEVSASPLFCDLAVQSACATVALICVAKAHGMPRAPEGRSFPFLNAVRCGVSQKLRQVSKPDHAYFNMSNVRWIVFEENVRHGCAACVEHAGNLACGQKRGDRSVTHARYDKDTSTHGT